MAHNIVEVSTLNLSGVGTVGNELARNSRALCYQSYTVLLKRMASAWRACSSADKLASRAGARAPRKLKGSALSPLTSKVCIFINGYSGGSGLGCQRQDHRVDDPHDLIIGQFGT